MKKLYLLLAILIGFNSGSFAQTTSFLYTGSVQYFTVPLGVTNIGVIARGARGGYNSTMWSTACSGTLPDSPGKGACVEAKLAVTPGQVLNIYVGQCGTNGFVTGCAATPGVGGYNGGGNGGFGYGSYGGGGGGGASDVRVGGTALTDRLIVAAGGGGAGGNYYTIVNAERGGNGGGLTGEDGYGDLIAFANGGAQGAGPLSGGAPGTYPGWASGIAGVLGIGGNAGTGIAFSGSGGGGGGGGLYGGGGGSWGGGGGGSSYTDPILATAVIHTRGCNDTDGSVDICLNNPGTIIGIHPICSGLTLSISETVGGGVWSSSNPSVATIGSTTGIVNSIIGGTSTITYTVTSACATVYATATFVVTPSPDPIVGQDPVCVGTSFPFTDPTPGGKWSISGTAAATISKTGLVAGIYPGSATVTYTAATGPACYATFKVNVDGIAGFPGICKGLTAPLISSTGGGTWTSSDTLVAKIGGGTGTVGTLSGIQIGTATISYSSTVCPSSITVTVYPIAPNAGADSICRSSSDFVTNIIGGGMWSSSDGSVAKVGTLTGLVTGISAGTAVISYLLPTGCVSRSQVLIVDKAPPITGFPEVCPGNTTTLADPLPGGIWGTLNGTVATVNASSGVVTGVNADTVSIIYTIRPGCATPVLVKVNPIPFPITGRDTLCPGVLDTLFDKSKGGMWSTSTPAQDTIIDSTGILTSRLSGMALIKYTLPTGCYTTKNVYIYPVPTPTVTYNPYTNSLYTPLGYPHYQWYDSITGLIPHATSPTLAATYSQWYFVEVTDTLGCKSRSGLYHHDIAKVGVDNLGNDIVISIYPNPVRGSLNIESTVKVRAVISSMDGKIAMQKADAKQMDVSGLASAVYLISLYDETGQLLTVQKLIKE